MGMKAGSSEPRELLPERTFAGVVVGVYFVGTVPPTNPTYKASTQFIVSMQLFKYSQKDGFIPGRDSQNRPLEIAHFLPFYMGSADKPSKLKDFADSCFDQNLSLQECKSFDIETLLGKSCMVSIKHHTTEANKQTAKVNSTHRIDHEMFGDANPEPTLDLHYFDLDTNPGDPEIPAYVPKFVAAQIQKSNEWRKLYDPEYNKQNKPKTAPAPMAIDDEPSGVTAVDENGDDIPF